MHANTHANTQVTHGFFGRPVFGHLVFGSTGARRHSVSVLALVLGLTAAPLIPGTAHAQQDLRPVVADLQVRITQMEEMVRSLTGQLEQSSFRVRQLEQRLDLMQRDMDLRLRELEGTGGGASVTPRPSSPSPSVTTAPPSGGGVLGYLPSQQPEDGMGTGFAPPARANTPSGGGALPSGPPEEQYSYAFSLLRQGEYAQAEQAFGAFIQANPTHSLAGNAQYWLGETFYARGDYENAAVAFAKGYREYSGGSKTPDNLFKLGMSMSALGKQREACAAFQKLQADFPDVAATLRRQVTDQMRRNGC